MTQYLVILLKMEPVHWGRIEGVLPKLPLGILIGFWRFWFLQAESHIAAVQMNVPVIEQLDTRCHIPRNIMNPAICFNSICLKH